MSNINLTPTVNDEKQFRLREVKLKNTVYVKSSIKKNLSMEVLFK